MNQKRPLKNQLSEEVIRKVIVLEYKKGKLPAVIAHESGYHIKSVQKIIRRFASKRIYNRRKGAGRPKVLNQSEKTIIRNKIRSKPWLACKELANRLGKLVSPETIRVYLKSLGYSFKKPTKKPLLNDDDKFERLTWAKNHKNYDFSNVIFADEASFWLHSHPQKMWIKKGEEHLAETTAHPAKVNVWGYITQDGILTLETFQENLNAELLVEIMKDSLTSKMNRKYGKGRWVLGFDNDSKHRAEETIKYL